MNEDEDRPPRVPAPREGGHEYPADPFVPAPRVAPAIERLAGSVATMTAPRVPSTALVRTERRTTALALRAEGSVASRLRAVGRDVVRMVVLVVGAAVQGVRSLLEGLGPCPRRGIA